MYIKIYNKITWNLHFKKMKEWYSDQKLDFIGTVQNTFWFNLRFFRLYIGFSTRMSTNRDTHDTLKKVIALFKKDAYNFQYRF